MKSKIKVTTIERVDYQKIILSTLALTGLIGLSVFVPNVIKSVKPLIQNRHRHLPYYLQGRIIKLKNEGYVQFTKDRKSTYINLTPQGQKKLQRYRVEADLLKNLNGKWDGKWRIVIFDIKEYRRGVRDQLRRELESFGFARLQNSVWVFPYYCEELIILLKADLKIGRELLYIISNKLESDIHLRKRFGLD